MAEVTISTGGEQTGSGSGSGSVTSVDVSGGTTGLTTSGGPITSSGTITVSGTLAIANGGTGQTTANAAFNALSPNTTRGDITVRNATVNARLALGAAGTILRSDGTDLVYSTNTFPNTTGLNEILYATSANVIGSSANFKLGSNLTVLSPTGGIATGIVLTQSANNGTAANSYTSIDFNVPTTGLIGQFLSTASNYSAAGVNVAGNSICLAAEAAAGQLALMATGASGYITFNTGGFGTSNERLRILSTGEFLLGKTAPTIGELVAFKRNYAGLTTCMIENANASGVVSYRVAGDQKNVTLGIYNSASSFSYGMMGANEAYIYGNTNLCFMAEGASSVIKWSTGSSTLEKMRLDFNGNLGIGVSSPTAVLHLKAGTATANTAPLKFNSGTSLTSAEAGAMEFTTDDLFFTITTGTARKRLLMADPTGGLTSGRISYATTNGRLTDSSGLTFDGTNFTTTGSVTTTQIIASNKSINTTAGDSATINAMAGRFRKDTTGSTFTLTNSFITADSIILCSIVTDLTSTGNAVTVVAGSGSAVFTFWTVGTGAAAPSTDTDVNFLVVN